MVSVDLKVYDPCSAVMPLKMGVPVMRSTVVPVDTHIQNLHSSVMPAHAGIQGFTAKHWIPASAGMTLIDIPAGMTPIDIPVLSSVMPAQASIQQTHLAVMPAHAGIQQFAAENWIPAPRLTRAGTSSAGMTLIDGSGFLSVMPVKLVPACSKRGTDIQKVRPKTWIPASAGMTSIDTPELSSVMPAQAGIQEFGAKT